MRCYNKEVDPDGGRWECRAEELQVGQGPHDGTVGQEGGMVVDDRGQEGWA